MTVMIAMDSDALDSRGRDNTIRGRGAGAVNGCTHRARIPAAPRPGHGMAVTAVHRRGGG